MESTFGSDRLSNGQHQDDIAIIGMSCIFPGAPNLQTYWQNIISKVDAISDPPDKWGAEFLYDPDSQSNDRIYCKRGGYLKELAEFNPLQYGVMPSSIPGAEPGHFLALRVAYESLADAGYLDRQIDGAKVEVILGKGAYLGPSDMTLVQHGVVIDQTIRILKQLHPEHTEEEIEEIKQELHAQLPPFNAETVPGWVSSIITGRINNRLDFMGPNYTLDAACASSLIAVERGMQDLRTGRCDMALVGGVEPCMPPLGLLVFCQINALSHKGKIRPFDKDASGTLLGEGLGIVVLKRRHDAERDGDRIYAVIKSVGVSSDGRGAGLLAPRLEGEALALARAYEEAAIDPRSVGLIEAHGTAVPLGDVTEVQALSRIFGQRLGSHPSCAMGSVKSMISHLVHAAGIAGLIKAALALYNGVLPPTLNCDEVNPELELEKTPFYLNTESRPWIHGAEHPRRAGVSSFGFGGINAHAILEQYGSSARQTHASFLQRWETEVCIIQGESRRELITSCQQLLDRLSRGPEVALKDLAYSLNCPLPQSAFRLAIVASSLSDLEKKLTQSLRKLNDTGCASIRDARGIYFFEQPLSREGALAFMFPGYGSQYVNMLSDLCVHFPDARSHFDKLDKIFLRSNRALLPSQVLYPPPGDKALADISQEHLFSQMAFASSVMCTADLALFDLLTHLEIRPDAFVGHSNGEFVALVAAGAIKIEDEDQVYEYALHAQNVYNLLADQIPTAKILAVGGGDPAIVRSLLQQSDGALQLTIDNCPHQMVLCGAEDAVTSAFDYLQKRGVICTVMPFNHAVHSPLFQLICDQSADFYQRINLAAPRIPVYSCTTTQPHPQDPAHIRQLTINHLARPVRFRETIESMYAAGARIFLEVGPKGNLTGFVNDILGDRPYVAVPSNVTTRSDITQLNHAVGLLVAHHVPMRLDYLYGHRSPNRVAIDSAGEADQQEIRKPYSVRLSLDYPLLKLKENGRAKRSNTQNRLQEPVSRPSHADQKQSSSEAPARLPASQAAPFSDPTAYETETEAFAESNGHAASEAPTLIGETHLPLVMDEYMRTMEHFLKTQQDVVGAFLTGGRRRPAPAYGHPEQHATSSALQPRLPADRGPFNLSVQSLVEGRELAAACRLDLEEHVFLRDHTLGRSPSKLDETLMALSIVPLTITMEILAQAAALLIPGKRLVGMKNFRAHRWIEVDEGGCTLFLAAKASRSESALEVDVRIVGAEGSANVSRQGVIAEGSILFADEYPAAPRPTPLLCQKERPYSLRPEHYYDSMFHGPCFRSVVSIDQFDRNGIEATLMNPPLRQLFRSRNNSDLLTDPVLLDGAGQVIGFWTLDRFEDGGAIFPIGFEAMEIYGPFSHGSEPIKCTARIRLFADGRIRSDIDLVGAEGHMLARLLAWEDMRALGWTHSFNRFLLFPEAALYSSAWSQPVSNLPPSCDAQCRTVSDGPGGIWPHLLASMILNRRERSHWARLGKGESREWLLGRLAAKDAARLYIKNRYGLSLCPADIEIITGEHGDLSLAPELVERLGSDLMIAISHAEGRAAAIAGTFAGHRGIGIEIMHRSRTNGEQDRAALAAEISHLLSACPTSQKDEWLGRILCAKEATASALGRGMSGSDLRIRVADVRAESGQVVVAVTGNLAGPLSERIDEMLTVQTGCEGDLIFAVSLA